MSHKETVVTEPNLAEIHDILLLIAKEAGELILSAKPNASNSNTKKNSADPVTETDQAVEAMVYKGLRSKYPTYEFMGEETHKIGSSLTSAPTFIVDPIDGTTNFIHGFPNVCISLALCVDLRPSIGIVYNPFTSLLYSAIRGQGAFVRTVSPSSMSGIDQLPRRIPLANPRETKKLEGGLKSCLMAIEWGSDRSGINWDSRVKLFSRLGSNAEGGGMVHGFRSTGSAAMNMCSVGAGEMDAFFEAGAWAWDVAAGWVILEEAGGKVVDVYPRVKADSWEYRSPSVDGRLYFGVRGATEKEQLEVVNAFWACVGEDVKFDYSS